MIQKLNKIDKKILYVLNMNSRLPFTKIAKLTQTSREVVEYRVKRLIKLGIINRFSTIISSARLGLKTYHLLMKLSNASEEEEKEIIDFLVKQKFSKYVRYCRGQYDLVYVFSVRNNKELSEAIDEINEKYSTFISQRELLIPIKPLKYSEYPFLTKVNYQQPTRHSFKEYVPDNNDKEIINILRNNSRVSFKELSYKLSIPQETARFKFNRLVKSGLVKDFSINVNTEILGYVSYNLYLKIENYNYKQDKKIINRFYDEPFILSARRVVGKYDLVVEILCKNSKEFEEQFLRLKRYFKNSISNYEITLKLKGFHKNTIYWD
tara:strand:+ start:1746 stop:2711 length:966 start_codon:yes stop_codon:yes gene_type:complete